MNTLNICDFKEKTKLELTKAIVQAVKDTQMYVIQPLPDELLMTQDQFDLLKNDMQQMYQSDLHLFRTTENVMEVRVKA